MINIILLLSLYGNTEIKINTNCERLYNSGQGNNIENMLCAEEYKIIEKEQIEWKRKLLNSRGIY